MKWPTSHEEYMKLKMQGKDPFDGDQLTPETEIIKYIHRNKKWLLKNGLVFCGRHFAHFNNARVILSEKKTPKEYELIKDLSYDYWGD